MAKIVKQYDPFQGEAPSNAVIGKKYKINKNVMKKQHFVFILVRYKYILLVDTGTNLM